MLGQGRSILCVVPSDIANTPLHRRYIRLLLRWSDVDAQLFQEGVEVGIRFIERSSHGDVIGKPYEVLEIPVPYDEQLGLLDPMQEWTKGHYCFIPDPIKDLPESVGDYDLALILPNVDRLCRGAPSPGPPSQMLRVWRRLPAVQPPQGLGSRRGTLLIDSRCMNLFHGALFDSIPDGTAKAPDHLLTISS